MDMNIMHGHCKFNLQITVDHYRLYVFRSVYYRCSVNYYEKRNSIAGTNESLSMKWLKAQNPQRHIYIYIYIWISYENMEGESLVIPIVLANLIINWSRNKRQNLWVRRCVSCRILLFFFFANIVISVLSQYDNHYYYWDVSVHGNSFWTDLSFVKHVLFYIFSHPGMCLPLELLLGYLIERVTFGLLCVKFVSSTGIF